MQTSAWVNRLLCTPLSLRQPTTKCELSRTQCPPLSSKLPHLVFLSNTKLRRLSPPLTSFQEGQAVKASGGERDGGKMDRFAPVDARARTRLRCGLRSSDWNLAPPLGWLAGWSVGSYFCSVSRADVLHRPRTPDNTWGIHRRC